MIATACRQAGQRRPVCFGSVIELALIPDCLIASPTAARLLVDPRSRLNHIRVSSAGNRFGHPCCEHPRPDRPRQGMQDASLGRWTMCLLRSSPAGRSSAVGERALHPVDRSCCSTVPFRVAFKRPFRVASDIRHHFPHASSRIVSRILAEDSQVAYDVSPTRGQPG